MNVHRERLETRDGRTIGYLRAGSGVPVVLLHALSANAEVNWLDTGVVGRLVDGGAEVLAPDLRGHGTSRDVDPGECSLPALVADTEDLIRAVGRPCHVVGYSLGALVAVHIAATQRVALSSMVLSGIGASTLALGRQDGRMVEAMVGALTAADPATITDLAGQAFRAQVDGWRASAPCVAALLQDLRQPHELDLGDVTVPTLVVNGEADAPPREIGEQIRGARFATVAGDHLTAPQDPAFAATIAGFFFETSGTGQLA